MKREEPKGHRKRTEKYTHSRKGRSDHLRMMRRGTMRPPSAEIATPPSTPIVSRGRAVDADELGAGARALPVESRDGTAVRAAALRRRADFFSRSYRSAGIGSEPNVPSSHRRRRRSRSSASPSRCSATREASSVSRWRRRDSAVSGATRATNGSRAAGGHAAPPSSPPAYTALEAL